MGTATDPRQLLPAPGGAVAVVGIPAYGVLPVSFPRPGGVSVRIVGPDGSIAGARLRTACCRSSRRRGTRFPSS
jgi:hypothetical protein